LGARGIVDRDREDEKAAER